MTCGKENNGASKEMMECQVLSPGGVELAF